MPINYKVKQLYDALKEDGADVGSEQEFNDWFFKPGDEGYKNRRSVYDAFKEDGADIGKDYGEFAGWLGLHAVEAQKQSPALTQDVRRPQAPLPQAATSVHAAAQKPAKPQPVQRQQTAQQPVTYFRLRRGGKDFNVSADEVRKAGGLQAWANRHPGAPVRVYMQGNGFNGHVDLSQAHNRYAKQGYKYSTTTAKTPVKAMSRPEKQPTVKPAEQPMTDMQKEMLLDNLQGIVNNARSSNTRTIQQMKNKLEYDKKSRNGFLGGPVEGGVQYNPSTGKMEQTYLTPQGYKTTSKGDADMMSQQYREQQAFRQRMKVNGLKPDNKEDVQKQMQLDEEKPMRDVLNDVWGEAEAQDKKAQEAWRNRADKNARGFSLSDAAAASSSAGAVFAGRGEDFNNDLEYQKKRHAIFDFDKMANTMYARLPEDYRRGTLERYTDYFKKHPKDAKGKTAAIAAKDALMGDLYRQVYERAKAQDMPKSKLEFLLRKIADQPLISSSMAANTVAAWQTGSHGLDLAEQDAMSTFGKQHKTLDIAGTVANMALDPVTYAAGGVGGVVGKKALQAVGKQALKGATKKVAERYAAGTLAGRVAQGAAGGAANFGTFNTVKGIQQQMAVGGTLDENGKPTNELSAGDILKETAHGLMLGAATGTLSPLIGNVADKAVKATSSTAGKVALRAGQTALSTLAEGTVFAIPDMVDKGKWDWDTWTDSQAMMLGFKASHAIKSAPRVLQGLQREDRRIGLNFEERLRKQLDASPADIGFKPEEMEELRDKGYTDLSMLFRDANKRKADKSTGIEERTDDYENLTPDRFDGYEAMKRLMNDNSVSEATRAKAYYILTGHMLPMSSVVGYDVEKDDAGRVTVNSVNARGGVVTTRRFANEKAAGQEIDNIARQAELNAVNVGEKYKETASNMIVMEQAIKEVAPDADVATVLNNYKMVKSGQLTDEAYVRQAQAIDEAIARNRHIADPNRPEAIREKIKKETGIDVDASLRKMPAKRTEKEQAVVDEYIRSLFPEEKAEKPNNGGYEQIEPDAHYNRGYKSADDESGDEMRRVKTDYDTKRNGMADKYGEDNLAAIDDDPIGWLDANADKMSDEDAHVVTDYVNARYAYLGMTQRANDDADDAAVSAAAAVDARANKDDNMVHPATLKDGGNVYIVSGNVVMSADGKSVDKGKSSKRIVVRDAQSGEMSMLPADDVIALDAPIDAQQERDAAAKAAAEQSRTASANAADGLTTHDNPQLGDEVYVRGDDGKPVRGIIRNVDSYTGDYMVETEAPIAGKKAQPFKAEQLYDRVQDDTDADTVADMGSNAIDTTIPTPDDSQSQPQQQQNSGETSTDAEQPEQPQTPQEPMPMRKDGEEDWQATTPERAHSYIYGGEAGLSRQEGNEFVEAQIAAAKTAFAKAQKAPTPKMGTSIKSYNEAKAKRQGKIDAAKAALDYWQQVRSIQDEIQRKEAETDAQRAPQVHAERAPQSQQSAQPETDEAPQDKATDEQQTPQTPILQTQQAPAVPEDATTTEQGDGSKERAGETEPTGGTGEDGRGGIEEAKSNNLFQYFTGTLADMIARAKLSATDFIKKIIAPVSPRLKKDLQAYGIELNGDYNHVIDSAAIRHALKQHGSKNEEKRGQIPITDADIESISDIVKNYDNVKIEGGKRENVNIIYSKTYKDGTTVFVEEKRDKRKELAAVTMWKRKSPTLTDANREDTTPISDLNETSAAKLGNSSESGDNKSKNVAEGEEYSSHSDDRSGSNHSIGATSSSEKKEAERQGVNTEPSEKQKEAGNYKKGHIKVDGYDITIENPKGSTRSGKDASGKAWSVPMHYDYGYIKGTEGVDGDHIDVYLSDNPTSGNVYVVDQIDQKTGKFDKHKVMYGFPSKEAAVEAYKGQYEKGWKVGPVTEVSREDFKKWVESSKRKSKPFSEYNSVKEAAALRHGPHGKNGDEERVKKSSEGGDGGEEYEKKAAKIRAEEILKEGLPEDAKFGTKAPSDIKSVEDIENNVTKIISGLKDAEEGKIDFDNYDGYVHSEGYDGNAGEQLFQYINGLREVTPELDKIIYEWAKKHSLRDVYDTVEYGKKFYQQLNEGHKKKGQQKKSKQDKSMDKASGAVEPVTEEEAELRDAVAAVLRKAGIEVIDDDAEGQRVLDMENGHARMMSFGEPYDYEKNPLGRVEPDISNKKVGVVATSANHGFANYTEAKAWAKENVVKTYNTEETGGKGEVRISNGAVDKFLSQSAVDKSDSKDVHLAVLKVLPDVLMTSIDVETHPDFLKGNDGKRSADNGMNRDVLVHRCYGAVSIDGKLYRVKITLKEDVRNKHLPSNTHSYEATKIELLAGTLVKPEGDNPNTSNSISATSLLKNVGLSYNPSEKVLSASEKRTKSIREQRVYHGSAADSVRFFRTANGEAYGFTVGGKIYIDPKIAKADTPIHEYTHLWAEALRKVNPKEWQNVVGLMKQCKAVWEQVKREYPELTTDDEIADEVLAHYSGKRGAERLRAEMRKAMDGEKSMIKKAGIAKAFDALRDSIKRFWKHISEDIFHIHFTSAEEVADKVMYDLLNKVKPGAHDQLSKERAEIERRAKEDGTWMKAPNGKESNLTEEQWVTVRTRQFKDWFGDWENDPEEASQAVDENGEPKVFYHNTDNDFTVFDANKNGTHTDAGWLGDGFYFYGDENEGNGYGHKKMGVFLNARNLYYASSEENEKLAEANNRDKSIAFRNKIEDEGYDAVYYNGDLRQEAVVFYPEQIKSATDNVGTFDAANPDIRYQFVGEKGAASADRAEEATTRLDNLSVARKMEEAGKDAHNIKMATGWERGADEKWRYEIPDFRNIDPRGNIDFFKNNPDYKRYFDLIAKSNKAYFFNGEFTKEEESELSALDRKLHGLEYQTFRNPDKLTLKDYMDAPELFKAYPQLRNLPVKIEALPDNTEGAYTYQDGAPVIKISKGIMDSALAGVTIPFKRVMAHEIQHAIQLEEGFAKGGSEEMSDYLRKNRALERRDDTELYASLAGEVEARNAARRVAMTDEQRRRNLASDTEDVSREDQIYLYDSFGIARSEEANDSGKRDGEEDAENATGGKTLMGVHNISIEKLLKAIRQGGLANPSMAVVNTENGIHDKFGEISLIPPSSLIDKIAGKNAGTWTGDAYTPRYPKTELRMSARGRKKYDSDMSALAKKDPTFRELWSDIDYGYSQMLEGRDDYDSIYSWFLADTDRKIPTVEENYPYPEEYLKRLNAIAGKGEVFSRKILYELTPEQKEEAYAVYRDYAKAHNIEGLSILDFNVQKYKALAKRAEKSGLGEERVKELLDKAEESKKYGDALSNMTDRLELMGRYASRLGSPRPLDKRATFAAGKKFVEDNGLKKEFATWLDGLQDRYDESEYFYTGTDEMGRQMFKKNSLRNASAYMKVQGRAGSEGSFTGFGGFAAKHMKQLSTTEQIRTNKGLIREGAEERNRLENLYFDLIQMIMERTDTYNPEAFVDEIAEASDPISFAKKEYGIKLPKEYAEKQKALIDGIQKMPALYFETKFERPVYLSEFEKAVVPDETPQSVVEALTASGIEVYPYKSGDEESRKAVTMQAVNDSDDILFRLGDKAETFEERQQRAVKEKGVVMPGLNKAEVKVVDVPRHSYTGTIAEATKQAIDAAKEKYAPNGKPIEQHYDNHGQKFDYTISGSAIDESLNPKQQAKSDNKGVHLAVVEHLDEVIGESIEVEEHPDYKKNSQGERDVNSDINDNALMHRFYGAVVVDGQLYRVMILMREDGNPKIGKGLHAYEVTKVEVLNGKSPSTSSGVGSGENNSSYPLAKLLQNVEKSYDPGKKILDESAKADENSDAGEEDNLYRTSGEIDAEYPNWLEGTTTDSGKHTTQVAGTRKTYGHVGDWIERHIGKDARILDASSGMGYGTKDLRQRGFNIEDVEPYQSEERKKDNPATYSSYGDVEGKYNYIISNAVLNVIPDDWRSDVLHDMASRLKAGGRLFINTRKAGEEKGIKDKIELDSPQEVLVKRNGKIASYQRFFTPQELKEYVEKELGEGYKVEIANEENSGTKGLAAVVVTKESQGESTGAKAASSSVQRMTSAVNDLAQKLHLNNVEIVTEPITVRDKNGKVHRPKGYFNPKTGKITISIANNADVDDAVSTLLHEAVAHYGLRQLLGENFNTFLDNVFANVNDNIRKKIEDAAKKRYDGDTRTATEEYLASLAEDENFEEARKQGVWDKIKDLFFELLHKVGVKLKRKLTDNDLRYMLWRSYENLKEGKGGRTMLQEAADAARRDELGIRNEAAETASQAEENREVGEKSRLWGKHDMMSLAERAAAGEDPELLFRDSVGPQDETARKIYDKRADAALMKIREAWQDSMINVKNLQDAVLEARGENIEDYEDAYMQENNLHGVSRAESECFTDNFYKPLLEEVNKAAKGWYDRRTGRITIVAGNHTSVADAESTLLHEAVAHYGLRQLLGDTVNLLLAAAAYNFKRAKRSRFCTFLSNST